MWNRRVYLSNACLSWGKAPGSLRMATVFFGSSPAGASRKFVFLWIELFGEIIDEVEI